MASKATIEAQREEFRILQRISGISATRATWFAEVQKLVPANPTPADWLEAAEQATTVCDKCQGSGRYEWGACVNGQMTHGGPCFRCQGKGRQGQEDYRRNYGHTMHAIASACR